MGKNFFMAMGLLGLMACEDALRWEAFPGEEQAQDGSAEAALERAREAQADLYAPALYGAAVEALERGEADQAAGDTMRQRGTMTAEELARAAMEEAVRVREEAKAAAHRSIRDASVLFSVVEAVLSHGPEKGHSLPSDARLAELRTEMSIALQAYEAGDYAIAGHAAQAVYAGLAAP